MKTLHLIRHAKSSWDNVGLNDIDRPLNKRGIKACSLMAAQIKSAGCDFQHVYCSPATRAQATIEGINASLDEHIQWETINELYTFDARDLITFITSTNEEIDQFVMIGHNPAFTELTNYLSEADIANIPTCGYVQLQGDINWAHLEENCMQLKSFLYPKMYSQG